MNEIQSIVKAACEQVYPLFRNGAPTTVEAHCSEAANVYAIVAIGLGTLALFKIGLIIDKALSSRSVTQIAPPPQPAPAPATPSRSSAGVPPVPESPEGPGEAQSSSSASALFDLPVDNVIATGRINEQDPETGDTYLMHAAGKGDFVTIEKLHKAHAVGSLVNKQGKNAFHAFFNWIEKNVDRVEKNPCLKTVQMLIQLGADIDQIDTFNENPWAILDKIENKNEKFANQLKQFANLTWAMKRIKNWRINKTEPNSGDTPLMRALQGIASASSNTLQKMFYALIESHIKKENVMQANKRGDTLLHFACKSLSSIAKKDHNKYLDLIGLLLRKGADLDAANTCEETPRNIIILLKLQRRITEDTKSAIFRFKTMSPPSLPLPTLPPPPEPAPVSKDE